MRRVTAGGGALVLMGLLAGCGPSTYTERQQGRDEPGGDSQATAPTSTEPTGPTSGADAGSGGTGAPDGGAAKDAGSAIDPNAYWANDPPPQWCGPDGGVPPPTPPGGTPECPDDKNRQGCPCDVVGEQAPCWPGLRTNRGLGQCRDGVTTCVSSGEFGKVWGACQGYVLPTPGETKGAAACRCFSAGQWSLANLSPCFVMDGTGKVVGAVSTWLDGAGNARCPTNLTIPPKPQPGTTWTTNTINVDCAGTFELCYELKAGNATSPQASDCSVVKVCTKSDHTTPGVATAFPPLPAWTTTNTACAAHFSASGGYGEMSVVGKSVRCDPVDDGQGKSYVFNRVQYCKSECGTNPNLPECKGCGQGGSGTF